MKKNNFIAIGIASILVLANISSAFAQNGQSGKQKNTTTPSKYSAQDSCLDILGDYVKRDSRFDSIDISKMPVRWENYTIDLTDYSGKTFLKYATKKWNGSTSFYANRNNIGTISAGQQYIVSEFVTFGNHTQFSFPYVNPKKGLLETGKSETDLYTESYGEIRDKLIYTHHIKNWLNKWSFLSCGFLKITPKNGKTHADTGADNYKTNFIDSSGFELLKTQKEPEIDNYGNKFLVGKVNVPIKNYSNEHHMTLELLTVIYDNKNKYFNEFETFPLQVKAMTDEDRKEDVNAVQKRFLDYVNDNTCLMLVHPTTNTLPQKCEWEHKSLTSEWKMAVHSKNILDYLIPKTFAQENEFELVSDNNPGDIDLDAGFAEIEDYSDLPRGMYINNALSFEKMKKLESLNNPLLTAHVLKALSDGIEQDMEKPESTLESHDNQVFLQCGMDYETRVKLINEWIDSIDVNTFSIDNITYPDPKIGDCLIPFPDVRHKDKIIENSFLTNQYNAAVRSGNQEKIDALNPVLQFGNYKESKLLPVSPLNNSLIMILGIVILLGWVSLIVFLLKNKKGK